MPRKRSSKIANLGSCAVSKKPKLEEGSNKEKENVPPTCCSSPSSSRTFVNWKVREKKSGEKSGSPGNSPAAGFGRVRQSGGRVEAGSPDPRSTADQTGALPPQLVSTQSLPPLYGKGKNRYKE
ncbi:hypothetical protein FIBSPDRAFT_940687 [Athelia psychrophila]|uniref:Uncharacterized protein n=1 Tax=Athelia psychrophila TaxID=1759441 RepID=A0A167VHL9_9AGAM|nr:hypothetical protein FIBSPDRAFT_940687 [Fibularhizoctonia sp. CBS 109695]